MTSHGYMQRLKSVGATAKGTIAQTKVKAIEEYWPSIERTFREKIGPAVVGLARDDERLTGIVRAVYSAMPLAFRMFVGEADFIRFCLTNRNKLLPESEHLPPEIVERMLDEGEIREYITSNFAEVHVDTTDGSSFFFYGLHEEGPRKFPFATLVTSDQYDQASNLNREGVFRLNIAANKETFQGLFGAEWTEADYDFLTLDCLMPHPVYGKMYWVCVLSPSETTFERVKPLLAAAYEAAVKKHARA